MIEGTGAAQFSTIAAAAHGCGAIVGATALQIAAPSIAERLGIPYVFTAYCPAGVAAAMIAAARALGRRSIVSRGWAHLSLSDDEGDALAIAEVNQQALFTRVAAVVHHGGAGTTTGAAQAGTPQVIVPAALRPALLGATCAGPRHRNRACAGCAHGGLADAGSREHDHTPRRGKR